MFFSSDLDLVYIKNTLVGMRATHARVNIGVACLSICPQVEQRMVFV